jgi:hypothetical protein
MNLNEKENKAILTLFFILLLYFMYGGKNGMKQWLFIKFKSIKIHKKYYHTTLFSENFSLFFLNIYLLGKSFRNHLKKR